MNVTPKRPIMRMSSRLSGTGAVTDVNGDETLTRPCSHQPDTVLHPAVPGQHMCFIQMLSEL